MVTRATDLPAIEQTVQLGQSAERVWRAISDPGELAQWFPQRAAWKLEPGAQGKFHWEGHGDFHILVEAVDEPRYIAWRWARTAGEDPRQAGASTLVEWWAEPIGANAAVLRVRESGFALPEHRAENETGWNKELGELVALLDGSR